MYAEHVYIPNMSIPNIHHAIICSCTVDRLNSFDYERLICIYISHITFMNTAYFTLTHSPSGICMRNSEHNDTSTLLQLIIILIKTDWMNFVCAATLQNTPTLIAYARNNKYSIIRTTFRILYFQIANSLILCA